ILDSNPGIGGTEYLIIAVATLLSNRNNDIDVTLYTQAEAILPDGLRHIAVGDISAAQEKAIREGIDALIFKHNADFIVEGKLGNTPKLNLIPWCHVFLSYWEMDYYATNPSIKRIIFVGREMMDLYRDHRAFDKCAYIFNCLNVDISVQGEEIPFGARDNVVTYMGALVPFKGFHLLAKAWPDVVKEIPDAQLYVIGSGKLYNKSAVLGKWGIADESYEAEFMPYLTDGDNILPNVHFMGTLGAEKYDILKKTKVGVPNPSGITETFCLTAVEMQMMGAKIATIVAPGYLDTVKNGILHSRSQSLSEIIVRLLRTNSNEEFASTIRYFQDNFSFTKVAEMWESIMLDDSFSNNNEKM
ncbi:MAG: glycosyltransferase family 4 protein, partial [Bacteroidales bacterium]|nr:glycosyltransferase family 4 protein [Bacteroidales bacterium]